MTTGIAFCEAGAREQQKRHNKKGGAKYVNSRFRCKTAKIEKQKKEPPQAKNCCCYKGPLWANLFFDVTEEDYVRNL